MLIARKIPTLVFLTLLLATTALTGCTDTVNTPSVHDITLAPLNQMPQEIRQAPVTVREAYQFAIANPEILEQLPCYCGCGPIGHESNYACYAAGKDAAGQIQYDAHALGCSICVDITQDAMRLLGEGKDIKEIRSYVDNTYAQYGPTNMP